MSPNSIFDEMDRVRRSLDHLLDEARPVWRFPYSRASFLPGRGARSYPLMNIAESPECYQIHALAPGLDPDSLDVSVTGRQVTIAGTKLAIPDGIAPEQVHRSERAGGRFARTATLAGDVEADKVEALYERGLLSIKLPKAESARTRKIQVTRV